MENLNPTELKALKHAIVEITVALEEIDSQKEQIKSIVDAAEDKFGIKKKFINKVARVMFKHNFSDLQKENYHI